VRRNFDAAIKLCGNVTIRADEKRSGGCPANGVSESEQKVLKRQASNLEERHDWRVLRERSEGKSPLLQGGSPF
jgi:hypothetical protein